MLSRELTALILGIVEGLTEYIPVSSTGHLVLVGDVLEFTGATAATFSVFIQLGAILAVVVLYWHRFRGLLNFQRHEGLEGFAGMLKLGVACLPALLLGALAHGAIKEKLFNPITVASALIIGGVVMIVIERRTRTPRVDDVAALSLRDSLVIGLFQCFALWPGMSRSGSTIIGGMLVGCSRKVAAEFSFLVAVPIMVAAVGYDMLQSLHLLSADDVAVFAIGFVVSFVTAILAVRVFISLMQRTTLTPFGVYRIALGALVVAFWAS